MRTTKIIIAHCPGCKKRFDFINPPATFTKLCGCTAFFIYDRGDMYLRNPLFIPTSSENGLTTDSPKWG